MAEYAGDDVLGCGMGNFDLAANRWLPGIQILHSPLTRPEKGL